MAHGVIVSMRVVMRIVDQHGTAFEAQESTTVCTRKMFGRQDFGRCSGRDDPAGEQQDVINDLQQRRAIITATEIRGGATVLTAEAPLASMFGYSAAVRSVSQGRASFTMAPLKYGPAPAETAEAFM